MFNKNIKFTIVIAFAFLLIFPINVFAKHEEKKIKYFNTFTDVLVVNKSMVGNECSAILGDVNNEESTAWLINKILNYIKILGPILALVLGSVDFAKAIVVSDEDNMRKVRSKFVKRIIAAMCIFFVPLLSVEIILFVLVLDIGLLLK